jgi:phosphate starvation-inducible PhoH-like protein
MARQAPKVKTERTVTKFDKNKKAIELLPKNDNQDFYIKSLRAKDQVVVFGPAGTGKTYVVATEAASLYHTKAISRIIITRPHVAVGKDVGYLPGTLEEKCAPWSLPVIEVLERHLGKGVVETGLKNGNIETAPLALMRGRSFDNAFVIVDEAQNITLQELKMVLTRIGEGSKLVLNGDIQQSDLKEGDGLTKIIHLIKKHCLDIPIVEFTLDDIVRSGITKEWVKVFTSEGI